MTNVVRFAAMPDTRTLTAIPVAVRLAAIPDVGSLTAIPVAMRLAAIPDVGSLTANPVAMRLAAILDVGSLTANPVAIRPAAIPLAIGLRDGIRLRGRLAPIPGQIKRCFWPTDARGHRGHRRRPRHRVTVGRH
jgi:hypothetical protein